ncbi:MAG: hypothetical protein ACYC64_10060 [Armatimonadota bacterium]
MIKKFSVSTPAFPWDILDKGVDAFLDGAIEHIGANAVFTPACYYMEEVSAFWWGGVMPHNKVIHRYFPEDGKCYFMPNERFYENTKIKPERTSDPLLDGCDNLRMLEGPVHERGMKLAAWIPLFKNPQLARSHTDCTPVDIFGGRSRHGLCPNNPHVEGYYKGIVADILTNYKVDSIGLDKFGIEYWAGGPQGEGWYSNVDGGHCWSPDIDPVFLLLNSPCFCTHCERKATEWGYDWDRIKARVSKLAWGCLDRDPSVVFRLSQKGYFDGESGLARLILEEEDVYQWLRFKIDTMVKVARDIKQVARGISPDVKVSVALDPPDRPNFQRFRHYGWMYGTSYRALSEVADSIGVASGWSLDEKYYSGMLAIQAVDGRCPCDEDVHAVHPADPDHVREQIRMYHKMGMSGYVIFGHTWAPLANLHAAQEELVEIEQNLD